MPCYELRGNYMGINRGAGKKKERRKKKKNLHYLLATESFMTHGSGVLYLIVFPVSASMDQVQ